MPSCTRHPFERSVGSCSRCRDSVCRECRVEARRRLFCLDCALAAAGVRTSGRSGRSAAQYRRRLNGIYSDLEPAAREIDLRDGVAPAPQPIAARPAPIPALRTADAGPAVVERAVVEPPTTEPPTAGPAAPVEGREPTPLADVRRRLVRRPESTPIVDDPDLEAEETAAWLAAATEIQVTTAPSPRRTSAPPLSR